MNLRIYKIREWFLHFFYPINDVDNSLFFQTENI